LKEIGKILLYLIATVVLGALIAPPLYWLGQGVLHYGAQHGWVAFHNDNGDWKAAGHLAFLASKFRRYFDRAILISAFALLWPLVRSLKIRSWRDLGLERNPARWRQFAIGLLISIASVLVLGFIAVESGCYTFVTPVPWGKIALLPIGALAVAVIEESLFRGAMQGLVQRATSAKLAILFVSALYAIVHFLKPPENAIAQIQITWTSGFTQALQAFWQFRQPMLVLGGFTTLFMVGVILGYARQRTRSLWLPVGLHAGWIIAKMGFTKIAQGNGVNWPWFGPDLLTGLVPVVVVLLTGAVVWWWLKRANENFVH
jgi:membrane protease YdiL (CAAX protease family)